jgi:hypothetical protein
MSFGTITSYSLADAVGRIRLDDGTELRFGATALRGVIPAVSLRVRVGVIVSHPLGWLRALEIEAAEEGRSDGAKVAAFLSAASAQAVTSRAQTERDRALLASLDPSEIRSRVADVGYHAASPAERTVFLICDLDVEMTFRSALDWLGSPAGELAMETARALRDVGASRCAALFDEMMALFGPAGPPKHHAAREIAIEALSPATIERWEVLAAELGKWPDDIGALLEAFIAKHVEPRPR